MELKDSHRKLLLGGIGLLAAISFAYAVIIAQQILLWALVWIGLGFGAVLFYLFWRLIRALERYADAVESQNTDD